MTGQPYSSIRPGQVWLDTDGKRIQAHGGSILAVDGTYYWYGENKERSRPGSGIWHWGVRCYSSTDLYNWVDRGLIIPPEPDDPDSPLHPARMVDRPHIIHNRQTGQFVCWIKVMGDGVQESTILVQESTVLVADSILGPYRIVRTGLRPLGMNAGDFDLVVDPADGKAYYYFERVHSELICADLTPDCTDVTGYYSTHFPRPYPPLVREGWAYFRRGPGHYLFSSGTSWYFPNQSEVARADTYHGPWTLLGNPHPGDASFTSYGSQITSVFKHPDRADLYIALADRWVPNVPAETSRQIFLELERAARGDPAAPTRDLHCMMSMVDTSIAEYVWLPIRFDGETPLLDWHNEWRIEDFE